jgi:hypothetical protein
VGEALASIPANTVLEAYVFHEGPLKSFGGKWRNATARSNVGNDLDENRLIVSYALGLG